MIIYSKSSGNVDAAIGRIDTPIKMYIEHESDLMKKKGGIRDWLFNVEKSNHFAETVALCPEMDHTVAVAEKEKGWVEKDIAIHSEKPAAPLAVIGMAFRYKIKGRIKHT